MSRTLRNAGYQVLGLGRGAGNEVRADLLDRDGLLRAVRDVRADVVVHGVTALRKPPLTHKGMHVTDDLRVTGTASLLDAARAVGARRFIGENIVFGYGYRDFGDRVLTRRRSGRPPPGPVPTSPPAARASTRIPGYGGRRPNGSGRPARAVTSTR